MSTPSPVEHRTLVLLASYPKSGSTWLRMQLSAFFQGSDAFDINALGSRIFDITTRARFDHAVGIPAADLPTDAVRDALPFLFRSAATESESPTFVKVHQAYARTRSGQPIFPADCIRAVVHLVRNPLDVAVSMARINARPIDWAIDKMLEPDSDETIQRGITLHGGFTPVRGWHANLESWTRQTDLPMRTYRYEDMLATPETILGDILSFSGIAPDAMRIAEAIEATRFERLRTAEAENGFSQSRAPARSFFRRGIAGSWRDELEPVQVARLVTAFREPMRRLGYLDEEDQPVRDGEAA